MRLCFEINNKNAIKSTIVWHAIVHELKPSGLLSDYQRDQRLQTCDCMHNDDSHEFSQHDPQNKMAACTPLLEWLQLFFSRLTYNAFFIRASSKKQLFFWIERHTDCSNLSCPKDKYRAGTCSDNNDGYTCKGKRGGNEDLLCCYTWNEYRYR